MSKQLGARTHAVGLVRMHATEDGGRTRPATDGYRAPVEVKPGVQTSAAQTYPVVGIAPPGQVTEVQLKFFFPELVEGCLWPGKRLLVREGSRVVAEIELTEVPHGPLDLSALQEPIRPGEEAWNWSQWDAAADAYGEPFDPRALFGLLCGAPHEPAAWAELWSRLYHQGDIGSASLLSVPLIAEVLRGTRVPDWNPYALACTIEAARGGGSSPWPPALDLSRYLSAFSSIARCALGHLDLSAEPLLVSSALAAIAVDRGLPHHAEVLALLTDGELRELLERHRTAR